MKPISSLFIIFPPLQSCWGGFLLIQLYWYFWAMAKATRSKHDGTKTKFKFDEVTADLTDRQKLFCMKYVACRFNGTKAALEAGYAKVSAGQQAERLLKNDEIKKFIKALQNDIAIRTGITAESIALELAKIGFSNIQDFIEDGNDVKDLSTIEREKASAVSSVKKTVTEFGDGENMGKKIVTEFKLWDKRAALESLNTMLGFNKPTKVAETDSEGNDKEPQVITLNINGSDSL